MLEGIDTLVDIQVILGDANFIITSEWLVVHRGQDTLGAALNLIRDLSLPTSVRGGGTSPVIN